MADQDRFRFNLSDEEPEIPVQDEDLKKRVNKLGQRVSFLTLLLPCLLAIALYMAHSDLAMRVNKTESTELKSVERISAELEQQLASLNSRIGELEAASAVKVEAAQTGIGALQEASRKNQAAVEKIDTVKADKKELSDAITRIDAALATHSKDLQALAPFREELGSAAALRKEVEAVSSRLQKLEDSLGKDLTGLAGYMDRTKSDLTHIKTDLANLQARKLDRESMDLEMLKAKKLYQMALDQEMSRLDKTLNTIQRRLDQVERAFGARPSSSAPSLPPLSPGIQEQTVE